MCGLYRELRWSQNPTMFLRHLSPNCKHPLLRNTRWDWIWDIELEIKTRFMDVRGSTSSNKAGPTSVQIRLLSSRNVRSCTLETSPHVTERMPPPSWFDRKHVHCVVHELPSGRNKTYAARFKYEFHPQFSSPCALTGGAKSVRVLNVHCFIGVYSGCEARPMNADLSMLST